MLILLAIVLEVPALAGPVRLLSSPNAAQTSSASAGGDSWNPIVTPDGRFILFASTGDNLVALDNGKSIPGSVPVPQNVFLCDRLNGTTVLVSVSMSGAAGGNGDSIPTDLSTNGHYALFESSASNLVPGDTNAVADVFARDLVNGTTLLISVSTNGVAANGASRGSVLTPDGRFAAFVSDADNLVPGDTNHIADVFVRNLQSGITTLASVGAISTNATKPGGGSESLLITPDGQYVAFYSTASNLVTNAVGSGEVYVRDLVAGTTIWASSYAATALGSVLPGAKAISYNHSISADGKFIAYEAALDPSMAITNPSAPAFILRYRVDSSFTDVISANASVPPGTLEDARSLDMTADGRFVAFLEDEFDNSGNTTAVWVWDAQTGAIVLASGTADGVVAVGSTCESPVLSPVGRFVAFFSSAAGLVTNSVVGDYHLYVRDLQLETTTLVDADTNGAGTPMVPATIPRLTADGRWIAFESANAGLVANDRNRAFDVFTRDIAPNITALISAPATALPSLTPNGPSSFTPWSTTADGRLVTFASEADNVVPEDTNACRDVFLRDLATGTNRLISVDALGISSGNGVSAEPTITLDGRYIAFTSSATNLVSGDTNAAQDVFLRDLLTSTTTLVSVNLSGAAPGNNHSYSPQISADGRFILFRSWASNLAAGSFSKLENLFVRDLLNQKTYALSTNGFSCSSMSRDGRFVAVAGAAGQLFVWSSESATKTYSSTVVGGVNAIAISPDGNKLSYWTATLPRQLVSVDLVARTNWVIDTAVPASKAGMRFSADSKLLVYAATAASDLSSQIYLYDFQTAGRLLLSRASGTGASVNGDCDSPEISPDGRFIAYRSAASDLVVSDADYPPGIFLLDRSTGVTTLLSSDVVTDSAADNRSFGPVFTEDGQTLLFASWASDLVTGDFNQSGDIFGLTLFYEGISPSVGTPAFSLVWPLIPGKSYHVQFKDSLADAAWTEAAGTTTNIGTKAYFQESAPVAQQRFYRTVAY